MDITINQSLRVTTTMEESQRAQYPKPTQKDVLNTSENAYLALISDAPAEYNFAISASSNHRANDTSYFRVPVQAAIDHLSGYPVEIDPIAEGVLNLANDIIPTSLSYLQFNIGALWSNLILGSVSSRSYLETAQYHLQALRDGNATVDYLGNVTIVSDYASNPDQPRFIKLLAANLAASFAPALATQASPTNATWYQYQAYKSLFLDDDLDAYMGVKFTIKDIVAENKSWPVTLFDYQEWVRTHNMWTFLLPTSSMNDMLVRLKFLAAIAAYTYGKRLQTNSGDTVINRHWAMTCQVPNDETEVELQGVSNRLVQTFQDLTNSCVMSMMLISYYLTIKDEFGQTDDEFDDDSSTSISALISEPFVSTTATSLTADNIILP